MTFIHQGDATEIVVDGRYQRFGIVTQMLGKECPLLFIEHIHVGYLDAFLLGAPVVVLGLHLHELQMGADIRAETDLLTIGVTPLVLVVHIERRGVEIGGIVLHVAFAVDVLHEIVVLCQLQQLT